MRKRTHDPEPLDAPLVALIGRPNVGKSTLFNRLCGGHDAIVEDKPGVTRDRRYGEADFSGVRFRVVDTGGLDLDRAGAAGAALPRAVLRQAQRAMDEAALILFILDAREGLTPQDIDVAAHLRRLGRPVLYIANKVDSEGREPQAAELYALGAPRIFAISAAHGRGISDLLDAIVEHVRPIAENKDERPAEVEEALVPAEHAGAPQAERDRGGKVIRIAFVGRPNAGKSSLVNALLGEERMIVDAAPGTTRDPVDTLIEHGGQRYLIIDTAGIRRRAKIFEPMEKVAVAMAEKAVGRADVAILVIDAKEGIGEQDAKIAGLVHEAGRVLVIAMNKRDLIGRTAERWLLTERERILHFVPWARTVFCSATRGSGLDGLLAEARRCFASYNKRVSTGALNRFFEGIVERHPPPLHKGRPIRLYYITQTQVRPPTFVLSVNHPEGMHFSYHRYLLNQLRETFGFEGSPVVLITRTHGGKRQRPRA